MGSVNFVLHIIEAAGKSTFGTPKLVHYLEVISNVATSSIRKSTFGTPKLVHYLEVISNVSY